MKVFALVFAVCIIGAFAGDSSEEAAKALDSSEEVGKVDGFTEQCIAETGVDKATVDKVKDENVWTMDDKKLQCTMKCMLKKINFMNDDGVFNVEEMKKQMNKDLPADKVDSVIQKCTTLEAADACEKALKAAQCFIDNSAIKVKDD